MKHIKLFLTFFALAAASVFTTISADSPYPDNADIVYTAAEKMPVFPGGEMGLIKYINEHISYPEEAKSEGRYGRVVVKFVVTEDGSVGYAEVVRPRGKYLDEEALRVIKSLPKFEPGEINGKPVKVWYTVPVNFKPPY